MDEGSEDGAGPEWPARCLKEIAAYCSASVRSVRRWEKEEGLPVRRHVHEKGDLVYAFQTELDDWLNNRGKENGQGRRPKKSH